MPCLIEFSQQKVAGYLAMMVRRSSSALMGFVILEFSFEFYTVL